MKEIAFTELGYFLEDQCKAIKNCLQGYSYMNFDIAWSNCAGNCTLIVRTECEDSEENIKNFFLFCALGRFWELGASDPVHSGGIKVFYEEYRDDNDLMHYEKRFTSLNELEEWIFDQMKCNYSDKKTGQNVMFFPVKPSSGKINFSPHYSEPVFSIHKIETESGIIFSDGTYTSGKYHMSQKVKDWCQHCHERQYNPQFAFAE